MTRLGKRLIQAAQEAIEIATGRRPARMWVKCQFCDHWFLVTARPANPKEMWTCADHWDDALEELNDRNTSP